MKGIQRSLLQPKGPVLFADAVAAMGRCTFCKKPAVCYVPRDPNKPREQLEGRCLEHGV